MSNRQTLAQAIECFADPGRRHEYFKLYSDDIVLHGYQGVRPGLESVKQFYYAFWKVFPDAKVTVQELIEQSDTLVARYVITGAQHAPLLGVMARGQHIELPGISVLHFFETVNVSSDGLAPIHLCYWLRSAALSPVVTDSYCPGNRSSTFPSFAAFINSIQIGSAAFAPVSLSPSDWRVS